MCEKIVKGNFAMLNKLYFLSNCINFICAINESNQESNCLNLGESSIAIFHELKEFLS